MDAAARDIAASGNVQQTAQRLITDLVNWVQHGTVPSYMREMGAAVAALGEAAVEELVISGDMSLHLAADARAAFGAKLRIRADGAPACASSTTCSPSAPSPARRRYA